MVVARGCIIVVGNFRTLHLTCTRIKHIADSENLDIHLYLQAKDRPLFHGRADATLEQIARALEVLQPASVHWHEYTVPNNDAPGIENHTLVEDGVTVPLPTDAPAWAMVDDTAQTQRLKKANVLFPQFFIWKRAFTLVLEYEIEHRIEYNRYVRTRPDLWVDFTVRHFPNPAPDECVVPVFESDNFIHGIGDHFAICGRRAAHVYFICEEAFRDGRGLASDRSFCFFQKPELAGIAKHYESTHATLHCHLVSHGIRVITPPGWVVTATPSPRPFYVVRV